MPPDVSTTALRRLLVAWLWLALSGTAVVAQAQGLSEYRLKAAFLYNFAQFTEWPAAVGSTLNLCVYGQDPFGAELDGLHGRAAGPRSIAVQRKSSTDMLKGCQIVFIAPTAIGNVARVLNALDGLPVLTVSDSPGALRSGVALNMVVVQDRITFEANLPATRAARLSLSSKLLRVASEVLQ